MKKRGPYKTKNENNGIYWHKATQKWECKGIGYFSTIEAARAAQDAIRNGEPVKRG
jgi:hypothetical protein